jgi:hypothetical protein
MFSAPAASLYCPGQHFQLFHPPPCCVVTKEGEVLLVPTAGVHTGKKKREKASGSQEVGRDLAPILHERVVEITRIRGKRPRCGVLCSLLS